MKFAILTAILFGFVRSQTEYVPNVPDYVSAIFEVIGTSCVTDTDCESAYMGPSTYTNSDNAVWSCMNDTLTDDDGVSKDISLCVFDGCEAIGDCSDIGGLCWEFESCNPDTNLVYPGSLDLGSSICIDAAACNDGAPTSFREEGEYTNETMCYTAADGLTYTSEEYAVMCMATCIIDADLCLDPFPMTTQNAANQCVEDETCCSKDGWDEEGCLELLITTYLMYTIIVAVVLCLCCVGCCCCIYKKRKNKASFEDNMDNQTNHYNVYI
mmetsp:Transcript_17340/g.15577  ORF Transcript_17340/g.15577 Transcript_17340/m.15577 type:complete len:269 (+) Transcript_17340:81-887(+)